MLPSHQVREAVSFEESHMRKKLAAVAICAASLLASACSDHSAPAPTAPAAMTPRTTVSLVPFATLACDFTVLKADVRDFAVLGNRDPLATIVGDLQALVKNGPTPAGTDKVYDGLSRLALMRGNSTYQKTSATGALFDDLVRRLLGCAESYVVAGAPKNEFKDALKAGWAFEVRGEAGVDAEEGVYERGATGSYWAAEASPTSTWAATISVAASGFTATDRALVFGYRRDSFTNDPNIGSAFEHFTLPPTGTGNALTLSPSLNIGLCNVATTSTLRVQHVNTILNKTSLACAPPPAGFTSVAMSQSMIGTGAALARQLFGFFAPQNAYAAFAAGSVGGAVSELSPSAVIDLQQVTLAFAQPIADGTNSTALKDTLGNPVKVTVTSKGGTPLPYAIVKLTVAGNNSTIAYFTGSGACQDGTCVIRTADTDGVVLFDGVKLTKAGGYTLAVSGTFDTGLNALTSPLFYSNPFNIQNK
jgi:hypothetical protein